jgi:tetratricopeptide (TPR) repeat protein
MNCPKCGTPTIAGTASCIRCGVPLRTGTAQDIAQVDFRRFCSRCGSRVQETDAFCLQCGARILISRQPPPPRDRWRRYAVIGGLVALLLLLIAGGLALHRSWQQNREVTAHYMWGISALQAGDYDIALQELGWVVEQDPHYQDTQEQIETAQMQADLNSLYSQAQSCHSNEEWELAIEFLEKLQNRAADYEADAVRAMLHDAYFNAGLALAEKSNFDQAIQHFDQCLALKPDDDVQRQRDLASLYLQGLAALEQGDHAGAIQILREVYTLDPSYHRVTDELCRAYLAYCTDLENSGDLARAEVECQSAHEIKPKDGKVIVEMTRIAYLRTPTPTPTTAPATTPTVSPSLTVPLTSTITPSPTPRPTSRCRYAAKNLIGFKRQNRCDPVGGAGCGPVEIWVMDADGSNQAPMCNPQAYYWGLERDRTSPGGEWRLEVSSRPVDIYRFWPATGQKEWIIQNNRKDWDPVVSADGWWLAWVTNRNANDEIYIKTMDPSDQQQRRLTVNEWEWDKHPTWSPDGRKIAFYSNRANKLNEATRQIWVMDVVNDQSANLRNLSNILTKVDTDPVWFKWDGIPR